MHKLLHLRFILGLCITICKAAPLPSSSPQQTSFTGATILFQNDGDWRTHEQTPSALLINKPATYNEAVETCAFYGEKLLDCGDIGSFANSLLYQTWLQNIEGPLLWSSCSFNQPADLQGTAIENETQTTNSLQFPFLCTNTAPFVSQIDTDYSTFPRVKTPTIEGVAFEGLRDHMAYRFLGIQYAKPPVGDLRFEYAQSPEYTTGTVINATEYQAACMQVGSFEGDSQGLNPWGNSEDCLHLQVFTPSVPIGEIPTQGLKPVMLWMHGGAMINGAGSDSTFDGDSLVSRGDVVLVTINYRLNIFGLLSLDDSVVTGNYGLSDKVAALQWVKKYIAAFGGDPDNITIFGQSAGGASVMDLIASPKAKGLFNSAIPQSLAGNVVSQSSVASQMLPYLEPLCPGTSGQTRLECLQNVPAETLLNISTLSSWNTVIDGVYMVDQPLTLVSEAKANAVNVLIGFMPEESQSLLATSISPDMSNFTTGLTALVEQGIINSSQTSAITSSGYWEVPQDYTDYYNATVNIGTDGQIICHVSEFINAASQPEGNPKAFNSLWTYTHQRAYALSFYSFYDLCTFPVGEPNTPYYRCHSGDLYEVFGTYYIFDQPVRVEEDIYYTNMIQDTWAAFARTGNPNPDRTYLAVRGYQSSLEVFDHFSYEEYGKKENQLANLQWPSPWYADLPDQQHCRVLDITFKK